MEGSEPTVAQRTLQHRLADLPGSASTHVKMGFALSSKLEDNQLSDVVNYVASNFARRTRYDPDVASKISGIDRNIVGDLLSAVAITVGSVFDLDVSQEDFFTYIPENLLEEKDRDTVGKILTIALREKDSLKREFDQSKVANAVLPSFRLIEHSIDVRLSFDEDGEISSQVPVAVIYLNTDTDESIWFQVSPADLDELLTQVTRARERLEKACQSLKV